MTRNIILIILLNIIFSLSFMNVYSQGQKKVIQWSGVVVGQDSISGVGGVLI